MGNESGKQKVGGPVRKYKKQQYQQQYSGYYQQQQQYQKIQNPYVMLPGDYTQQQQQIGVLETIDSQSVRVSRAWTTAQSNQSAETIQENHNKLKKTLHFVADILNIFCEKELISGINQHSTLTLANLNELNKDNPQYQLKIFLGNVDDVVSKSINYNINKNKKIPENSDPIPQLIHSILNSNLILDDSVQVQDPYVYVVDDFQISQQYQQQQQINTNTTKNLQQFNANTNTNTDHDINLNIFNHINSKIKLQQQQQQEDKQQQQQQLQQQQQQQQQKQQQQTKIVNGISSGIGIQQNKNINQVETRSLTPSYIKNSQQWNINNSNINNNNEVLTAYFDLKTNNMNELKQMIVNELFNEKKPQKEYRNKYKNVQSNYNLQKIQSEYLNPGVQTNENQRYLQKKKESKGYKEDAAKRFILPKKVEKPIKKEELKLNEKILYVSALDSMKKSMNFQNGNQIQQKSSYNNNVNSNTERSYSQTQSSTSVKGRKQQISPNPGKIYYPNDLQQQQQYQQQLQNPFLINNTTVSSSFQEKPQQQYVQSQYIKEQIPLKTQFLDDGPKFNGSRDYHRNLSNNNPQLSDSDKSDDEFLSRLAQDVQQLQQKVKGSSQYQQDKIVNPYKSSSYLQSK